MAEAAGAAPAPASGGQAGQGTNQGAGNGAPAERGRIGDFANWSGRTETSPQQQIALQDPSLVGRGEDNAEYIADDFQPLDAQAQALVVDDSVQGDVISNEQAAKERSERLKRLQEWESADDLPDVFHQKFITATIDGQKYRIPVAEAIAGYQRNADYSNKLRQVYDFERQLKQQFQGLQALLADLDDGQRFLDAMVALGKFRGFAQAAMIYGKQLDAEQRMTPEQRAMVVQTRALRAENLQLQQQLRQAMQQFNQMRQQQAPQQLQQHEQAIMHQLAQMWPRAAQMVGFVDSPAARREFELHFDNMLPSLQGGEISTEFVANCMRAAMESVQAHLRAANGQAQLPPAPAAPQSRQQLPPGRGLPGPAPSSQNGNGVQRRARIGDLSTLVGRRPQ